MPDMFILLRCVFPSLSPALFLVTYSVDTTGADGTAEAENVSESICQIMRVLCPKWQLSFSSVECSIVLWM